MPNTGGSVNQPADSVFAAEWAATALVCIAAVVGPVVLGSTGPWARLGVETAMAASVVVWALCKPRAPWPTLLPLALAGLMSLQLVPWPERLLGILSPVSVAAWKESSAGLAAGWRPISVDPATTVMGLLRMILVLATFVATTDLARRAGPRRALVAAMAITAATIWALGLLFPFDKSLVLLGFIECRGPIEAEFWKTPLVAPIATNGSGNLDWVAVAAQRYEMATWIAADGFGPYLYANHFAGAICLTLPVAFGGWLTATRGRLPDLARHAGVIVGFVAALYTVGIMATSRAGAAALLFAAFVFFSLVLAPGWIRRIVCGLTILYAACLLVFALAMYGGFTGIEQLFPKDVQPRIAAMLGDGRAIAGRLAFRMFAASPLFGSGLGTFGELFTRFLRGDFLLNYAHNDYAQWLAETGIVGATIALTMIWGLVARFRAWSHRNAGIDRAMAAGPWAALAGIGVHSAFDWNLHIPANALLACIVAALAAASGSLNGKAVLAPNTTVRTSGIFTRVPGLVLALACLASVGVLARDAMCETVLRQLRQAIVAARIAAKDPAKASPAAQLAAAVEAGERMAAWDPANAQLAVLLGQANLHLAVDPQPIDEANARAVSAERWFRTARTHSAVCRGLPEPLPVPTSPFPR